VQLVKGHGQDPTIASGPDKRIKHRCSLRTERSIDKQFHVAHTQSFDPQDEEQSRYVDGNLLFLTYHEVGHMILDQVYDADQQADRRASEEAADDIATWLMLPDPDEPEQDEEIWAAMEGWLRSADLQQGVGKSPHYPDDDERAARHARGRCVSPRAREVCAMHIGLQSVPAPLRKRDGERERREEQQQSSSGRHLNRKSRKSAKQSTKRSLVGIRKAA
jgi:Zn-dependent peptidase ImmA (M78 family)